MTGHYPPICYSNIGYELVRASSTTPITVGREPVPFTEYQFEKYTHGRAEKLYMYNFFVVPGRGAVDDIKGVHDAAEDYERRFFGAAQFQVLMHARWRRGRRTCARKCLRRCSAPTPN